MKKVMLILILIFCFVFNVNATSLSKDDIAASTYIIGKYMFTRNSNANYNGSLTTRRIMLAAKTIDGNEEDMIIYYKKVDGTWIDALNGNELSVPSTFEVEVIDLNKELDISPRQMSTIDYLSNNINASTYIIGKYMFTRNSSGNYDGLLTTKRIMLAAKTITGNKEKDMLIYYKKADGSWINALTGDNISIPNLFAIGNIDLVEQNPDITSPKCIWGTASIIEVGSTGTIDLTCTDTESGIATTLLSLSAFTLSNSNVTISNITTSSVTNGKKFTLTLNANSNGTTKITLKANQIKDNAGNSSNTVASTITERKTYTVTFASNGASGKVESVNCSVTTQSSCNITLPTNKFIHSNWTFNGWLDETYKYENYSTSTYYKRLLDPGEEVIISADLSLKAYWIKELNSEWTQLGGNLITGMYSAYQPEIVYIGDYTNNANLNIVSDNGKYKYLMYFFGWACSKENTYGTNENGINCPNGYDNSVKDGDDIQGGDAIFLARAEKLEGPWQVYSNTSSNNLSDTEGTDYWDSNMDSRYWKIILGATKGSKYDDYHIGDPSVVYHDGLFYMAYSASGLLSHEKADNNKLSYQGPSSIGGAWSNDGIHWIKKGQMGYLWTIQDAKYDWTIAHPNGHNMPTPLVVWSDEYEYFHTKMANDFTQGIFYSAWNQPDYYGGYQRPHLMYDDGKWKLWFDFQGAKIGYAESKNADFLTTEWVVRTLDTTVDSNNSLTNIQKVAEKYAVKLSPYLNKNVLSNNYYNSAVDFSVVKISENLYYAYGDTHLNTLTGFSYDPRWHNSNYKVLLKNENYSSNLNKNPSEILLSDFDLTWPGRQIIEYISTDGLNWTPTGYIMPDDGYDANQIPEVFYDGKKICLFYANQKGSYASTDYTNYSYYFGPIKAKCKTVNN